MKISVKGPHEENMDVKRDEQKDRNRDSGIPSHSKGEREREQHVGIVVETSIETDVAAGVMSSRRKQGCKV